MESEYIFCSKTQFPFLYLSLFSPYLSNSLPLLPPLSFFPTYSGMVHREWFPTERRAKGEGEAENLGSCSI